MTTSLIIATYNWPEALELSLMSALNQSLLPDEIIVADDGSTEETKSMVDKYKALSKVPLLHVWHEDEGFRLAKIRNRAIAACSGDYVIQVDGDIIMHPDFVKDHVDFARKGSYVSGSRVNMNEELSKKLQREKTTKVNVFMKGTSNFLNGLHLPFLSRFQEDYRKEDLYYVRGCNMAFWRDDLVTVNGYNEELQGWGREDNEISCRLNNIGDVRRIAKFRAIEFHQYHPECSRNSLSKNDDLLHQTIEEKLTRCEKGLDQYL
ncbi:MAG: glycosyltransferase family 2 protein [Paludibacteraceae bacterium]|nr:glycosyltransferase family 2 protein [Paludibacteraceae bacterium]